MTPSTPGGRPGRTELGAGACSWSWPYRIAGADVIFGAHPHVLQPMETYRGRPIFSGLGNLVWPRISEEGSVTAIAEVTVAPDATIDARMVPIEIVSDGHPVVR